MLAGIAEVRVVQTVRLVGWQAGDSIGTCYFAPLSFAQTVGAMRTGDSSSRTGRSVVRVSERWPTWGRWMRQAGWVYIEAIEPQPTSRQQSFAHRFRGEARVH